MSAGKPPSGTTVLISGGGPVGLATAVELGTRNIECVVLEPRVRVSALQPRAKTSSVRTMEHFRRWGIAGVVRDRAALPVSWSQDAAVCATLLGPELTRFTGCFGLTPERHADYAESGQQVAQPVVEQVLREKVAELSSVTFATGWSTGSLTEQRDVVLVEAKKPDGTTHLITAEHVVGCDGPSGPTRSAIGSGMSGETGGQANLTIVFRAPGLARRIPHRPAVHYWIFSAGITGVLGRFDLDDLWWAGVPGDAGGDPAELVQRLLGEPAEIEVLCTDSWHAHMRLADFFQTDRIHLAGDAAHLNPPWGGHGYNTGIGDAVNIGWKLAAVAQGWGGAGLLGTYEAERRAVAQRTIDVTTQNMHAMLGLRRTVKSADPLSPAMFAAAIQRVMKAEFHSLGLVLGNDYATSPAVITDTADPAPCDPTTHVPVSRPGTRLPHSWLQDGRSVYDTLGHGLTLLRCNGEGGHFADRARARGIPLTLAELPASPVHDGTEALLVRPDQYIAWRATDTDSLRASHPETVLDQVLGHRFP